MKEINYFLGLCMLYTETIIHLSVSEKLSNLETEQMRMYTTDQRDKTK